MNGTSKQKIGELLLDNICFKTAEAIKPTQITASKNEVCLNIANPENGFAKEEIALGFEPQNASISYSVKAFDETIIQVEENDSDKFTISGIKSGETELLIQSDYAPDVNEKIHVNVKNYVLAKKCAATSIEGSSIEVPSLEIISGALEVRKDSALNEIGYYEVKEDGSLVLLEDITIENLNPSVAEVKQKDNVVSIIPKTVGTTYVDFEKDGFKNRLQIKVSHAKYYASITGFEVKSSYYNYPAIKVDDNTYLLSHYSDYQFVGKVSPEMPFDMTRYTVWIDGSSVDYDETTQILETNWAGESTVRLYPTDEAVAEGYVNSIYLTIVVKDTPSQPDYEINVITNGRKNIRLKDVELPEELKDSWEWKYPDMPVYVIPNDEGAKEYTLHYTKDDKYPEDEEVEVNVIKYNELTINEQGEEHRGAILVHNDGTTQPDTIHLSLQATANINKEGLLEYELLSKKKGLTIEKTEDGTYKVTAQKAGTYTLTANAYVREYNENNEPVKGRKILTTTYKITAVKEAPARDIQLTTDSEEFIVNEEGKIHYVSSSGMEGKTFTLNAKVLGADKSVLNTTLEWSITNKNIATVSYDKKNSHKAVVTLKDYGKAAIRVKAKDKAGVNKEIPIQIVNGVPHLLTSKVTVNLAYDYDTWQGENLAEANNGLIKVAKGQGGEIDELCLWNSEGEVDSRFGFIAEESDYIVRPKYYDIPTGKYKCTLGVRAETYGEWYKYPIEITVINKQPKVTIKTTQKPNLFYRYQIGRIDFSVNGLCYIGQIDWISNSKSGNGFHIIPRDTLSDIPYLEIEHKNVKTKGNKLADTGCAKGTLVIEMEGCREPLIVKNYKIEYTYKKPTIQLDGGKAKSKYVIPDMDGGMFNIKLYDSLTKQYLQKVDSLSYTNTNYYHSIESNSKNVTTSCVGENLTVEYLGKKNKEAVTYTLNSLAWREPLKVKYNIQVQKPTVSLTTNSIVCNKDIESSIRTTIVNGKKQPMDKVAGVKYSGEDANAEELIQSGILEIVSNAADLDIKYHCAKQLQADKEWKAGTYTIQLTPYYIREKTGEIQDLNTLTLKIKITDKPVSAKVTVKGTCDLVARLKPTAYFQAKFSNMDQSYQVKGAKLIGEASELFKIAKDTSKGNSVTNSYYIFVEGNSAYRYLVKAGVTYSFAVEYTVQATNQADGSEGETFVVRSNTIKVKTKQSVPQIKLSRNNVTAYVTDMTDGEVKLKSKVSVPKGYSLSMGYGKVDVDKDGISDIYISIDSYGNIWLRIYDENQLVATQKGKTYTIPLKITLTGSDGLSKEPVVNLKVTLKR